MLCWQGKFADGSKQAWSLASREPAAKSADLLTFYWFESGSRDSGACDVFVREVMMSLGTCCGVLVQGKGKIADDTVAWSLASKVMREESGGSSVLLV